MSEKPTYATANVSRYIRSDYLHKSKPRVPNMPDRWNEEQLANVMQEGMRRHGHFRHMSRPHMGSYRRMWLNAYPPCNPWINPYDCPYGYLM